MKGSKEYRIEVELIKIYDILKSKYYKVKIESIEEYNKLVSIVENDEFLKKKFEISGLAWGESYYINKSGRDDVWDCWGIYGSDTSVEYYGFFYENLNSFIANKSKLILFKDLIQPIIDIYNEI